MTDRFNDFQPYDHFNDLTGQYIARNREISGFHGRNGTTHGQIQTHGILVFNRL